jgi:hypothetical protein
MMALLDRRDPRIGPQGTVEHRKMGGARATPMRQRICQSGTPRYGAPALLRWCWRKDKVLPMPHASLLDRRPTVTATQLAAHLAMSRQHVVRLADVQHVIERLPDGRFDQDDCRLRYLRWLRDPARRSARSEADAEFQKAKTELIKIRIAEKHGKLILASDHEAFVETITGLFLSRLSGFAARCGGRDLAARRAIDQAVYDLRVEIAQAAHALGDAAGEPPDDDAIKPAPRGRLHP